MYITDNGLTAYIKPYRRPLDNILKSAWEVFLPLEEDCTQLVCQLRKESDNWNTALIVVSTPGQEEEYASYGFTAWGETRDEIIMGIMPRVCWD